MVPLPPHRRRRSVVIVSLTLALTFVTPHDQLLQAQQPSTDAPARAESGEGELAGRTARRRTAPAAPRQAPTGRTGFVRTRRSTWSGEYQLVAHHSGKCLDVAQASPHDGASVVQWQCYNARNQRWRLEPVNGGYYRIIASHSNKALAVLNGSLEDGAPVVQSTVADAPNQQWRLDAASGYAVLRARHSGKALDVSNALTNDGAPVVQHTRTGAASQQWQLSQVLVDRPAEPPATADIVRFLEQSTWGPTPSLIEHVRRVGFAGFLDEQFVAPMSSYPALPLFPTTRDTATCDATCARDNYTMYPLQNRFFVNAMYGPDQLRQRVAFALHQIIVVSGVDITLPSWMAPYLQVLDRNAFGNYRQLLYDITLNAAMGNYLDVNGNTRTRPNENYAREILQLFSLGTVRLHVDGTPQLDVNGQTIPTYTQDEVNSFARVFTGWRFATAPAAGVVNYVDPMVVNAPQHDVASKTLLNGRVLPANRTAVQDLNDALDNIFDDPNMGPFIARQLIQHLVTSNPTPGYVARIATVFNGDAGTPRGDMQAVVRAILLDTEARGESRPEPTYGRLRHPAQYIAGMLRAFDARSSDGSGPSDGYLNPQAINMGMDVFRPPSVFSYFSPGTVVPGSAGVRGPEFGLYSTSTALRRLNFVNTMVFSRIAVSANSPAGTTLDFTPFLPLASNPGTLVDALDTLLLHDAMSDEMRQSIVAAVNAVTTTNSLKRVRTAVYLVLTSSQYQVER